MVEGDHICGGNDGCGSFDNVVLDDDGVDGVDGDVVG